MFYVTFVALIRIDMETETSSRKSLTLIAALALLIVPFLYQVSWMTNGQKNRSASPDEKLNLYLKHFPSFLQNHATLSLIAFVFCFASLSFGISSIDRVREKTKWMAYTAIIFSFILGVICLRGIV